MKTILLSFKADVYPKLVSGNKIYEHRKVFPEGKVKAYLYISKPVFAISGVLIMGKRHLLHDWLDTYGWNDEVSKRINRYIDSNNKYAVEILEFHETNRILLSTLRKDIPNFVVPQMYYYLDNLPLLQYLEENICFTGKVVKHDFTKIKIDEICK